MVCEHEYMNMCPPPPIIDLPRPCYLQGTYKQVRLTLITLLGGQLVDLS